MKDITAWKDVQEELIFHTNILAAGFKDALSYHRMFPLFANCPAIFQVSGMTFGANLAMIVGSVVLYHRGVVPLLESVARLVGLEKSFWLSDVVAYLLYFLLWVTPICLLLYAVSTGWYQDIADSSFRYMKRLSKDAEPSKAIPENLYANVVWLAYFVQVFLLVTLFPAVIQFVLYLLSFLFSVDGFLYAILSLPFRGANLVSQSLGYFMMSLLYGWYGFDPHWTASGLDPSQRYRLLQSHFAYFVGFGLPYVLLPVAGKLIFGFGYSDFFSNYFFNYGMFLALFPACIVLGCLCDYDLPYRSSGRAHLPSRSGDSGKSNPATESNDKPFIASNSSKDRAEKTETTETSSYCVDHQGVLALPFFKLALVWSNWLMKYVDRKGLRGLPLFKRLAKLSRRR